MSEADIFIIVYHRYSRAVCKLGHFSVGTEKAVYYIIIAPALKFRHRQSIRKRITAVVHIRGIAEHSAVKRFSSPAVDKSDIAVFVCDLCKSLIRKAPCKAVLRLCYKLAVLFYVSEFSVNRNGRNVICILVKGISRTVLRFQRGASAFVGIAPLPVNAHGRHRLNEQLVARAVKRFRFFAVHSEYIKYKHRKACRTQRQHTCRTAYYRTDRAFLLFLRCFTRKSRTERAEFYVFIYFSFAVGTYFTHCCLPFILLVPSFQGRCLIYMPSFFRFRHICLSTPHYPAR